MGGGETWWQEQNLVGLSSVVGGNREVWELTGRRQGNQWRHPRGREGLIQSRIEEKLTDQVVLRRIINNGRLLSLITKMSLV